MTNANVAVRAIELAKTYGRHAAPVHALRGVSFEVRRGDKVALLGVSGSGKSTVLNLLGGLDSPTSGSVQVAGNDLGRMNGRKLAQHRLTYEPPGLSRRSSRLFIGAKTAGVKPAARVAEE